MCRSRLPLFEVRGTDASLMLGALTTMATAVVSYWVGSSAGSAAKDKLLRRG